MLEGRNLTFRYNKKGPAVLENVSLSIAQGERVGIYADSGFGKTTLCRLLSGYLKPAEGQVLLDGKPLPRKGYCPVQLIYQHPEKAVDPKLKMKDTLKEGGDIDPDIIKDLGIETDWLNRYPRELSGGELQRFCIARALNPAAKYLIADEISTMLDLITSAQLWDMLLKEAVKRNMGMVIVSHSMPLLEKVSTRMINLEEHMKREPAE